ncbi:hypothetical protein [Aureimonas sp. SK2]|uniref:hypothetical protein n=1 Tax=Aureimonas sp. SK2 TaxID=3015992 RepID=UPI00244407C4|nr:hypothetical protein [Aureimonas sp. SK2]
MTNDTTKRPDSGTPEEDARQIEAQFAGLDNDLVEVAAADGKPEARDETLSAEEVDETSAGGLQYPPGVRTSRPEAGQ